LKDFTEVPAGQSCPQFFNNTLDDISLQQQQCG
jgi:hypothetical protein